MAKVFRYYFMNGEIPMKKKALLAVLLAMSLLLSSCALIVKDPAVDAATVILKLGDREVTKAEVQRSTTYYLNQMEQYNAMFGQNLDITSPDVIASAQDTAVAQLKQDMVLRAKSAELQLDQLTEEELASAEEDAQASWEELKDDIKNYDLSDEEKALEGEELEAAIQAKLDEYGIKYETYQAQAKDNIVSKKLKDYVIKDVAVTDEEVKADYDSKVAADEEKYKEDANAWVSADQNSTTFYYTPAGIRRVKQILIKFKADDQAAIDEAKKAVTEANNNLTAAQDILDDEEASAEDKAKAEEDKAAAQEALDAANAAVKEATEKAFENLDADADAVLEALAADPDSWDKLQEEKNEDPGMKPGAAHAEKGYSVCEGMTSFDSAFVEAAMALQSVGDTTGKIRGESYGYYIIRYVGDEPEGPVDFDSVKEDLHSKLLSDKQDETYKTTVDGWIANAGIKEDLGALKN